MTMLLKFKILGRARNHRRKFLKLSQTSFSGICSKTEIIDNQCQGVFTSIFTVSRNHVKYDNFSLDCHFQVKLSEPIQVFNYFQKMHDMMIGLIDDTTTTDVNYCSG